MPESQLRSPDEMFTAAKSFMLDGREPSTHKDWELVMNFFASNIAKGVEESACRLLKMIYDIPLDDDLINQIAEFQRNRK